MKLSNHLSNFPKKCGLFKLSRRVAQFLDKHVKFGDHPINVLKFLAMLRIIGFSLVGLGLCHFSCR